jgi:predicted RNA-binding Zn ribbon-like protein
VPRGVTPSVLALLLVLSGCGGGKLSKEQYESHVCDIMIRAANAWTTADPSRTFADAADDLDSISAPADVEGFHKTLASEMKEFSETMETHGDVSAVTRHLHEWEKALSEIRASGYNVKPGWGTCPAG